MRRRILIFMMLILVVLLIVPLTLLQLYSYPISEPLELSNLSWSGSVEGETVIPVVKKLNFGLWHCPPYPPFKRYSLVKGIDEIRTGWCEEPYLPTWLPRDIRYADVYIASVAIIAFGDIETEDFRYAKVVIQFVGPTLEPSVRRENIEKYNRMVEGPGDLGSVDKMSED
ncbi:MAG: hypothetical protein QXK89_06145 [Candidatus Bathyarchaeia archaeon]